MVKILKKMTRAKNHYTSNQNDKNDKQNNGNSDNACASESLEDNKNFLSKSFKSSSDLIYYEFEGYSGAKALIVYIDGLINKEVLNRDVVDSFIKKSSEVDVRENIKNPQALKSLIHVANVQETKMMSEVTDAILNGDTAMFFEGSDSIFIIDSKGWEKRGVSEPDIEAVVRGPREGFIESINVNTAMLRRKIKNSNLVFESLKLGKQTQTDIAIAYIDGIVNKEVLLEVRKRLSKIDTDSILESGYIEQFIEDSYFSILATVGNTVKPDIVAAKILEGRVAIFCDGTPHVLTVPNLFIENIQSAEDYYVRPYIASILRIIRLLSFVISILLPALYVALSTYHQEMIPTVLLITMAGAREGVPLPALAEAFLMVLMFEFLRESGIRLPRPVGSAISIVGALVIGEAAVNAGLVSAPMVIVVAVTAVTSFIVPSLTDVMIINRFILLLLGGIMGLYGITCGVFVMMVHVVSLRSFGIPYTSPRAPFNLEGIKDYGVRFPLWSMIKRPESIEKDNKKRRSSTGRK